MDKKTIERAIYDILVAIGEDPNREGLIDTPARVARMYEEVLQGMQEDPKHHLEVTFPVQEAGLVLEKDITFHSLCEHHMLPFFGKVHIAYIATGKVAGLSKLARTVEVFARRLQIQERMGYEIMTALKKYLDTEDVLVMIEGEHMCMSMRGVKKPGTQTVTIATSGVFDNPERRAEVLQMIRV